MVVVDVDDDVVVVAVGYQKQKEACTGQTQEGIGSCHQLHHDLRFVDSSHHHTYNNLEDCERMLR